MGHTHWPCLHDFSLQRWMRNTLFSLSLEYRRPFLFLFLLRINNLPNHHLLSADCCQHLFSVIRYIPSETFLFIFLTFSLWPRSLHHFSQFALIFPNSYTLLIVYIKLVVFVCSSLIILSKIAMSTILSIWGKIQMFVLNISAKHQTLRYRKRGKKQTLNINNMFTNLYVLGEIFFNPYN